MFHTFAEIDCFGDVSKKPANVTLCKSAQTGLTSTTSHWDSLRTLSLIEKQCLIRSAANQRERPSAKLDTAVQNELCLPLYIIAVSSHFVTINSENWLPTIRSESGGEVNILGGDVTVIVRKVFYVNMWLILNGCRDYWAISTSQPNSVTFLLLSWMQCGLHKRKINETNFSLAQRNVMINSDENDAIFAHESQSALNLTVGFSNIYCKLQQIFNLDIKLK